MIIKTRKGSSFKIDKQDLHLLVGVTATVTSHGYVSLVKYEGVAEGKPKYSRRYLHRAIMNAPKGLQVDHINRDKTDNRRVNLRLCTAGSNNMNRPGSGGQYKGVHYNKKTKGWVAQITKDYKCTNLGLFDNPHDAADAYNKAAAEAHGEYAFINEIKSPLKGESARRVFREADKGHGTLHGYRAGCRCELCRTASARASRKSKGHPDWESYVPKPVDAIKKRNTHGTVERYKRGLCRCDECSTANRLYKKSLREKKKGLQ